MKTYHPNERYWVIVRSNDPNNYRMVHAGYSTRCIEDQVDLNVLEEDLLNSFTLIPGQWLSHHKAFEEILEIISFAKVMES